MYLFGKRGKTVSKDGRDFWVTDPLHHGEDMISAASGLVTSPPLAIAANGSANSRREPGTVVSSITARMRSDAWAA